MSQFSNLFALSVVLLATIGLSSGLANAIKRRRPSVVDESNWTQLLEGEWMLNLYAPWCSSCRVFEPEWEKFADWSDELGIMIGSTDVTKNPALSGRFMVRGLPTIYHIRNAEFRIYEGRRDHVALMNYIEEQSWRSVEPISAWFAPHSPQMSIVAQSSRLSLLIKDAHKHLLDNVGLHAYVSYLLFTLLAMALGALLGIAIVFAVELFQWSQRLVVSSWRLEEKIGNTNEHAKAPTSIKGQNKKAEPRDDGKASCKNNANKEASAREELKAR